MRKSLVTFSELFILLSLLFLLQMVVTASLTGASPEPFLEKLQVIRIGPPPGASANLSFLKYVVIRRENTQRRFATQQILWNSSGCVGIGKNRLDATMVRSSRLPGGQCS